jgi:hypothetical protein
MLVYQRVVHQGMISAMQNEVISAETTFLWSLRESSQGQVLLGDIEDQSQRWSSDVICATDNQGYHSSLYPLGVRYSGTISYSPPWIPRKSKLHDWKGTFDISSIHPMLGLVIHTNLGHTVLINIIPISIPPLGAKKNIISIVQYPLVMSK